MFIQKIKELLPWTLEYRNKEITTIKQKNVQEKILQILSNSYFDDVTNSMVINVPSNIMLNVKGSIINISQQGFIIDIADEIHLNPELNERTKINISKLNKHFDDVFEPLSKLIEDK